ncbi:hypothetical protein EMPG_16501 [Blastomyces silverae]|uniref:C2H2-type domain-containing protein n=1 Tax=Blastomyces silverae TaxID=2060906 RepID=A0A0H1BAA5_9EURO|nr:hypothetical protein EMPG_16501 [Blastomyces silverae]
MPQLDAVPSSCSAQPEKPPPEKTHVCSYPGCSKRFTRAEHLRRHALNHKNEDNTCERCGVHFNRPDLLGRHMVRHAKRDEEAGGPGLGVLETRKRTRRGPDGTIITKPTKKQARAAMLARSMAAATSSVPVNEVANSSSPSSSSSSSSIRSFNDNSVSSQGSSHNQDGSSALTTPPSMVDLSYHGQDHDAGAGAPISPPTSAHPSCPSVNLDSGPLDNCHQVDHSDPLIAPMVPGGPYEPYVEPIPGQFDAADGSWRNQDSGLGLDYEDFFDLDTATSFNMPFAATHNYNWLFDVPSLDDAFNHNDMSLAMDMVNFAEPVPDMWSQPQHRHNEFLGQTFSSSEQARERDYREHAPHDESNNRISPDSRIQPPRDTSTGVEFPVNPSQPSPPPAQSSTSPPDASDQIPLSAFTDMDWMGQSPPTEVVPKKLPQISEAARTRLLRLISQLQSITVEGNRIELSSPLLSINALQTYCDLFFTKFNVSYPLIHQPTCDPDRVDTLLLASIISMGATYSNREAHQLAVAMHDSLRNQLFSHQSFSSQPDLWVLQGMMLIDCFGKQRAGQKQRDMSQLFHCVLIKLIRRSNCPIIRTSPPVERPDNLDLAWRQAMDLEQRKRLAMLCFMWDTQHAVLFSQSLCMSAFEIRASLPCDEATWEANTADAWFEHARAEPSHSAFLPVLKAYITPNTTCRPRHLNAVSRIFLLHGLMSISSDLKRRDQTTLRSETPNLVGAWKARISRSYDLWKNEFDADCMNMKLNQTSNPRKFVGLKTATHVMYHAAHITLNVEVLDLQIYAGAPHILGRVVTAGDFERSQRVVTRWLNEDPRSAAKATRHASYILQDAIMNLNDWDDTDVFHYPWCLYLATLTCWAFHLPTSSTSTSSSSSSTALDRHPNKNNHNNNNEQEHHQQSPNTAPRSSNVNSLNPRSEMTTLVVAMTTCNTLEELSSLAGKFDTVGLTSIMSQQLASVRWAVVHDAMKVLVTLSSR